MKRRVVITGMGAYSPLGNDWDAVKQRIVEQRSGVQYIPAFREIHNMRSFLGAPVTDLEIPAHYTRKQLRTMGRVAQLAVLSADKALNDAGLHGSPLLQSGRVGISYGSTNGSAPDAIHFMEQVGAKKTLDNVPGSLFVKFMSHTCAANLSQFFQVRGRIIPTTSACTSGSQGIGYGYESIAYGLQDVMICGGSEELHAIDVAVFDVMFATSTRNDAPDTTPRPFDRDRDGLVVGEGAATLILESLEHAQQRGARIIAEVIGYGTNGDGAHMVNPSREGMAAVMQLALRDAGISPNDIDYINAHGTSTETGDVAESNATRDCFGRAVPISSFKSYVGHTLGACGAIEAWLSVHMLNEDWVHPTLNLDNIDPRCGDLDYVRGGVRQMPLHTVMTNNFAFGGVNTSLVLRKWHP
ncbi:MAG: beta-ketoacyl-ACP synthase [Myxococcales bacterium]|jgi:3-oxoacyl-[acyl-carrier-protein] synthase II|nr:beta-ketoacyl-ACP synthase [Myxococcales bacterium]